MFPVRLSVVTYNLWPTIRWPQRAPALQHFVQLFRPDILCLQELQAETQTFLDAAMPQHQRVYDALPGWTCESNIYWQRAFLEEVEHGAEDVGLLETDRRLFWVRLQVTERHRTILVSTAHFTYQNHPNERATGISPRLEQARQTIAALQRLSRANEPVLFMGDLNDPVHPARLLGEAGYQSCFAALGLLCPPTYPCYPTANVSAGVNMMNQTIDWIVSNQHARAIAAQVPHYYYEDLAPSDHWPVQAIYEI
jgi:endonuclease/exonuclease/phosphatase family metal-dependent hydrolase